MPFQFSILPEYNLVFYRAQGIVTGADAEDLFERYATHPQAASGQDILCDLSELSEVRMDLDARIRLQARMEPVLAAGGKPRQYILYAPTALSCQMAETFREFWLSAPLITVRVLPKEALLRQFIQLPPNGLVHLNCLLGTPDKNIDLLNLASL